MDAISCNSDICIIISLENDYITVQVIDRGIGIKKKMSPKFLSLILQLRKKEMGLE